MKMNKDKFRIYLSKTNRKGSTDLLSSRSQKSYLNIMETLSKIYIKKGFTNDNIYEIDDVKLLTDLVKKFKTDTDLKHKNTVGKNNYSAALNHYIRMLESNSTNVEPLDETVGGIDDVFHLNGTNLIIYGNPGCGKSYRLKAEYLKDYNNDRVVRTTFHPDYSNTDFVGQLVPFVDKDKVIYKFIPGPFTLALEKALANKEENMALVIEEINRGNAAAIFGDLFQLLDRANTGESEYTIVNVPIYNYLKNDRDVTINKEENEIYIPSNLSIYATMNTSDQGVYTLDNAFKRRWDFVKMKNQFTSDHPYQTHRVPGMHQITWKTFVETINDFIVTNQNINNSEDKQLGIFFVNEKGLFASEEIAESSDDTLVEKFAYKVFQYLWDDVAKFDKEDMFKEGIKTLDQLIEKYFTDGKEVFSKEIVDKLIDKPNSNPSQKTSEEVVNDNEQQN